MKKVKCPLCRRYFSSGKCFTNHLVRTEKVDKVQFLKEYSKYKNNCFLGYQRKFCRFKDNVEIIDYIICLACGKELKQITHTHFKKCCTGEYKSCANYIKAFPDAYTVCKSVGESISKKISGSNNWNWKGGTKEVRRQRQDNKFRGGVEGTDYIICLECGTKVAEITFTHLKGQRCTGRCKNIYEYRSLYPDAYTHCLKRRIGIGKAARGKLWSKERRSSFSEYKKEWYKDPENLAKQIRSFSEIILPTGIECYLLAIVQRYSLPYQYTGNMYTGLFGNKVPDFIKDIDKVVVEVNGNYWHSKKKTGRTKEQEEQNQIEYYRKYGYSCIVIWEHELKQMSEDEICNCLKEV